MFAGVRAFDPWPNVFFAARALLLIVEVKPKVDPLEEGALLFAGPLPWQTWLWAPPHFQTAPISRQTKYQLWPWAAPLPKKEEGWLSFSFPLNTTQKGYPPETNKQQQQQQQLSLCRYRFRYRIYISIYIYIYIYAFLHYT